MQIKSNGMLKFLIPIVGLIAIVIVLRGCQQAGGHAGKASASSSDHGARRLTDQEKKAIGVEADTPQDTVSTLVARIESMQQQLKASQKASKQLRAQNQRLATKNQNVKNRIHSAVSRAQARNDKQQRSSIDQLENRITHLKANITAQLNGNGQSGQHNPNNPTAAAGSGKMPVGGGQPRTRWVKPLRQADAGNPSPSNQSGAGVASTAKHAAHGTARAFTTAFHRGKQAAASAKQQADKHMPSVNGSSPDQRSGDQSQPGIPVYTVPKNATLAGSVAMSALLGRVPNNGTVQDPYPFKIVVGPDDLTANGIELPEVRGAIVSGTATGDWTLSCVRGTVRSITFVFADGTIRTVPKPRKPSRTQGKGNHDRRKIGYISNPAGLPCVPGQRKTNARKFILTNLLLSAGQGAANAVAGGQTTTSVNGLGATTGVTGNIGKYIASRAANKGLSQVRKWLDKRYSQTFDAIYVPPGQHVVVNISKELPIDYRRQGRQVHHAKAHHGHGLD